VQDFFRAGLNQINTTM